MNSGSSEIVLLNVSGQDKPGLMAMLTSTLAEYQARVLDVSQSVIHQELNLGMLIHMESSQDLTVVQEHLVARAHEMGANVRFLSVSSNEYSEWVASQDRPRYIITLLANGISAEQLSTVMRIIEHHHLSIDTMRRLSGRIPLDGMDAMGRASVEMSVRGPLADQRGLKEALFLAAGELTFDVSVQEDNVYRRNRRLVAFDMDSTLIESEVIDELAARHGVGDRVAVITERAMRGELEFSTGLRRRVGLLEGLSERVLQQVADVVTVTEGTHRLVSSLKHFGYKTAIISGGFELVGQRLQKELGIDYLFANTLEIENCKLTGKLQGPIVDAGAKADILRELCAQEKISLDQSIAIGDGANDLPMLTAAGLGVAYRAKPAVRESAAHAISNFGLDSVLYLLGFSDQDILETDST